MSGSGFVRSVIAVIFYITLILQGCGYKDNGNNENESEIKKLFNSSIDKDYNNNVEYGTKITYYIPLYKPSVFLSVCHLFLPIIFPSFEIPQVSYHSIKECLKYMRISIEITYNDGSYKKMELVPQYKLSYGASPSTPTQFLSVYFIDCISSSLIHFPRYSL